MSRSTPMRLCLSALIAKILPLAVGLFWSNLFGSAANGQALEFVSSTMWNTLSDVKVVGNYAYCAYGNALVILDISDPSGPSIVGSEHIPDADYMALEVSGNYAYVAAWAAGFFIYDVSNPENTERIAGFPAERHAISLAVSGDYAYVGDDSSRLRIFNIADPYHPVYMST